MLLQLQRIMRRYRDWEAVAALSERELADIGLSREQAVHLATLPHDVPERVLAMARIFGVPEEDLKRNLPEWQGMLATCDTCRDLPACNKLLVLGDFATPQEAGFCPNQPVFAQHAPQA